MASDWDTRNALGVAPLRKLLDEIEAISSIDELTAYFTKPVNGETCTKLWRSTSTIDPTHSDRYVLAVSCCPLFRKDADEYVSPTPYGKALTEIEAEFAKYLLVRAGYSEEEANQKIENCLKQEDKERISALVDEIIEDYHDVLNQADWISGETRKKAIEKLDSIEKRVLFPDDWKDYEYGGLDFKSAEEGGNFHDAYAQIQKYNQEQAVKDFARPVNNRKWSNLPHDVNCYYQPAENAIYILGAYAQGAVYSSEMSDEDLYAGLGTVIGHEISHAFNITGSQYDGEGNHLDWWTAEDKREFRRRSRKIAGTAYRKKRIKK